MNRSHSKRYNGEQAEYSSVSDAHTTEPGAGMSPGPSRRRAGAQALYDPERAADTAHPGAPSRPVAARRSRPAPAATAASLPPQQNGPHFARPMSWLAFMLLGMLVSATLLSIIALPSIEAALTLPVAASPAPGRPASGPAATATSLPTRDSVGSMPAGMTRQPGDGVLLALDSFQRADQSAWGTASDGHRWQADATDGAIFSIANHQGRIANGKGAYNAILGPTFSAGEVFFTGSISRFQQANLGAVLRWVDANDWYKAYIDGSQLVLLKSNGGMSTRLAAVAFVARAGGTYSLRFRISGDLLQARAWPAGSPEPARWMVSAHDTSLQSGFGGLRLFTAPGIVIHISAFAEMLVTD